MNKYNIANLTDNLVVKSETEQEWVQLNNLMTTKGYDCMKPDSPDTFPEMPLMYIELGTKNFINCYSDAHINHMEVIPASLFISANTDLADTTNNNNSPETYKANT